MSATMAEATPEIKVESADEATPSRRASQDYGTEAKAKSQLPSDSRSGTTRSFPSKLIRSRSSNANNLTLATLPNTSEPSKKETTIDPLSQHIIERIRPDSSNAQKARSPLPAEEEQNASDTIFSPIAPSRASTEPVNGRSEMMDKQAKDKKNRVSFLSRFRGAKKKEPEVDHLDEDDEHDETRPEGADAEMFSQPIGYTPRFAEPPKYIKVKAQGKKEKDFDRLFLAQELRGLSGVEIAQAGGRRINPQEKTKRGNAVWALEFSKDGRYLAAGGHDHIVRVWAVLATEDGRREHEREEEQRKNSNETKLSAPVFKRKPVHEYEGHTETVLDLSWSKNNFLLSSSMDKTVRLWHISRSECLCVFKHSDFITSIQFHPRDDRFFLAGSLDSKLRLWSIPDKSVAYWSKTNDLVTAVAFTPDGKVAIAGCLTGLCVFFETDGFRHLTQMHVRSNHGRNAKGSKITGIKAINYPPHEVNGDVKLLITSNDSRARIYNYRDKSVQTKFKGLENTSSQIRASFSDDARYVISGSEDKKAYIWSTGPPEKDKDKQPLEVFEAHTCTVTAAIMAPTRTRQLLQASGDPIFELCNPPPVQLISRSESQSSDIHCELGEHHDSVPPTPLRVKPEESPAYIARSCHQDGNIIVTADFQGRIKVFRQDCAHKQRIKHNESWETGSALSKKMIKRTSSIATRNSRHSMQDSLSYPSVDRIQSWRHSIDRSSMSNSPRVSNDIFPGSSPHRTTFPRARSPRKILSNGKLPSHPLASSTTSTPTNSKTSFASAPVSFDGSAPSFATRSDSTQHMPQLTRLGRADSISEQSSEPSERLLPDGSINSAFLAKADYAAQLANAIRRQRTKSISDEDNASVERSLPPPKTRTDGSGHLMPDNGLGIEPAESRSSSVGNVSMLTDGATSAKADSDDEDEEEEVKCRRCGSADFKAKKKARGNVLVCGRCGMELV